MRRLGFTVLQLIIVLAIIIILAAILFPIFSRPRTVGRSQCQSNLKQIALGIKQYIQDSDRKYPIVNMNDSAIDENNPLGWADALDPYTKSKKIFWCPKQIEDKVRDTNEKKVSDRDFTDYFYNRRLAGVSEEKMEDTATIILLGEGNDGTDAANARYSLNAFPAAWMKDEKSPIRRHFDGANFAYVDGHVKWMKPAAISDTTAKGSTPSFSIN